jgi:glycosyltransferase involved in cell wall biosynthesis
MLLLGKQLSANGVDNEYWFFQSSNRFPEFKETGRATLGPISQLIPRLDRRDFDVIHMTATDPAAPLIARLAGGARVVVTARGGISDLWNHTNCHAYTAISQGMAELNQPYTDLKMEVVRNSIDVTRYAPPSGDEPTTGPPIVAFVGRTTSPEKNFPRFVRIAEQLAKRKDVRIWIADPHKSNWDRMYGSGLPNLEVGRWEMVPHAQMPDFYRSVAVSGGVVLITSVSEGFGNVAPEAAACGARVASVDVLGLREAVVDGVTGRLFPADASDEDAAARVEAWMAEPHDAKAVSDAAMREFSPTLMVEKYLAIYRRKEQLLVRRPVPLPSDTPEYRHLLGHLRRQLGWRAEFYRSAAVDLAGAGYRREALAALGVAVRAAPSQFLTKLAVRQVLSVGKRVVLGPRNHGA